MAKRRMSFSISFIDPMNDIEHGIHVPVLFAESLDALAIRADGIYVDGTFGRGGHAAGVMQQLGDEGRLIAFDKDPQAVAVARQLFAGDERFSINRGSFAMLDEVVKDMGLLGRVDGVLMDLGVSSPQLDEAERGFSFMRDGPLDMRMDPDVGMDAAQWLASASHGEIARVLRVYGDENKAGKVASFILAAREKAPILTTLQLAEVIAAAIPARRKPGKPAKHPATKSFQAIRIFINKELDDLEVALDQTLDVLKPGGRLAVISFHSLEDRIVKRFIRDQARGANHAAGMPVPEYMLERKLKALGKDIRPGARELERNPRARSSVLRVAERLA